MACKLVRFQGGDSMNIYSFTGAVLLGMLCTIQVFAETSPEATLDTLYSAGADGSQAGVLEVFAPDAAVLGVGGGSRLQGQSLLDFFSERLASGNTWDYLSRERNVRVSVDGSVAWFDESLEHEQLGDEAGHSVPQVL